MKVKYCVTTATSGGVTKSGIFVWTGKSWRTAQLLYLVEETPAGVKPADHYKAFMKNHRDRQAARQAAYENFMKVMRS